jgi:hypothetical protein
MKQMQKVLDYVFTHVLPEEQRAPENGLLVTWFPRSERATYHFWMGKFLLVQHHVTEVSTTHKVIIYVVFTYPVSRL